MATISDILQAQGDAAAKARQARGTMWGSLAQYAGTIPREILADRAQERERAQVEQVRQLQIQKGQAEAAKADEERGKHGVLQQVYRVAFDPATGKLDRQQANAIIAQSNYPDLVKFLDEVEREGLDADAARAFKVQQAATDASQGRLYEAQANALRQPQAYKPPTSDAIKLGTYTASLGKPGAHWEDLSPKEQADYGAFLKPDTDTSAEMDAAYQKAIAKRNQGQPLTREETANVTAYERRKTLGQAATNTFITARQDPSNPAVQRQLEQQYRGVLGRVLSSRSSGLTIESQKIDQANHLLAVFDQYEDPNTHEYKIPRVQYNELALGLARLLSPAGQVGIQLENEIKQKTASGDVASWVTYLTGQPVTGTTQAVLQMMKDSIERQGTVAESNRDTYLETIREQAPTDLDPKRQETLEQSLLKLNRVRTKAGATQPPGATTGAGPKVGDVVSVGGKRVKITALHPDGSFDGDEVK